MKLGFPWSVQGIRPEARESAREAARRSGVSLGDWLNSVIIDSAGQEGVAPRQPAHEDDEFFDDGDLASVHARFDELARRIDRLGRSGPAAYAPRRARADPEQIAELIERLDRRLDQFTTAAPPIPAAVARYAPPGAVYAAAAPSGLDRAVAEISARQRALDGDAGREPLRPPQPMPPAPQLAPARAPLPAQDLSGLEQQLRNITTQIETLRKPGVEEAIHALRDELGDIGRSLTEAMPRRALDAIEKEVHGLTSRIAEGKQAGVDADALAGIERGLNEVRDALRSLTPAESLVGFNEAVSGLAHKIDLIVAQKDPATLQQLESAITTLRGISSHVASDETVGNLAGMVQSLAAKVEQIASAGAAGDALASLDQRISALADALDRRSQNGDSVPPQLEALVHSLAEKIEQIQLTRGDTLAAGHLEDRIVKLVEKLDASDSRLGHLEAIERGLADLLVHIEDIRANKDTGGIRDAGAAPGSVDALKRDIARTQDSLEAVHGTLGHVVDRLAMIEQDIRGEPQARQNNVGAAGPSLRQPMPEVAARMVAAAVLPAPAAAPQPPLLPGRKSPPIDPDLPPDHPLEPGLARPAARGANPGESSSISPGATPLATPAARIAASEAALAGAKPPVIPDPGGKSDFIAAARRAAQTANQDPTPRAPPRLEPDFPSAEADEPSFGGKIAKQMKSLFVASSVAAIVIGSLYTAASMLETADRPGAPARSALKSAPEAADETASLAPANSKDAATARSTGASPLASHSSPRNISKPNISNPMANPSLNLTVPEAAVSSVPLSNGSPLIQAPAGDITGSVSRAQRPDKLPLPPVPAFPAQPAFPPLMPAPVGSAGDKLPAAIGGSALRSAAAGGDPAAAYEIAARYAAGQGVPQSLDAAARWFERAANKGLTPAQFRLASLYEKGQGVKKDLKEARRLYIAAADKGNAKAMHNLAVLYAEGIDGKPDYRTASQWFHKAANRGISDSQYNLGILNARGIGIEKNFAESYKWFALAAAQGDKEAAKKRDEVAARIDAGALAAAQAAVKAWVAEPQPEPAVNVPVPPGGWDRSPSGPAPAAKQGSAAAYRVGKR